jgi:hypothetical protein
MFRGSDMKSKSLRRAAACLAIAGFAAAGGISAANAQAYLDDVRYGGSLYGRAPLLAVVGLSEQRISIYDETGKISESPVSSGATGYETPAGIYSIVQKEEEHYSSLYDDASMPYMERITWTGIALHAGELPGRPASHGCVRLPHSFAQQLYQITKLGMRVIVVPEDIAPAPIAQPALFTPRVPSKDKAADVQEGAPSAIRVAGTPARASPAQANLLDRLRLIASAKTAEAEAAARREKEARGVATRAAAGAAQAARLVRGTEDNLAKAENELKNAEQALEKAKSSAQTAQAEKAKAQALARIDALKAQLPALKADAQSKSDAAARAEQDAQAAATVTTAATEAAVAANRNMSPVSVFISRKTQRLYVRKANQPVFEAPVLIRDADKPIGTFIYTALNSAGTSDSMRWNVVSMYKNGSAAGDVQKQQGRGKARRSNPGAAADVAGAQAALDRLTIPQEAVDLVSETVLPGSSLIISDEGPSMETGKDTDFVVVMSGEPQGGMTIRRRSTNTWARRDDYQNPWEGPFERSVRGRRSPENGGFLFFPGGW